MEFEWDEGKRQANIAKHDIDFIDARRLFDGRPCIELPGTHAQEQRVVTVGILDQRFVTAVWTRRGAATRLISVRRSRKREIALYHDAYGDEPTTR